MHYQTVLRKCILSGMLLFCTSLIFAQQKTITGKVTDVQTGEGLPGVSIQAKGQATVGTISQTDGTYSMIVPSSVDSLIFSFVGFENQTLAISGSTLNAQLKTGGPMSEIVVIGYGAVRKTDLTGAVASIPASAFNKGVGVAPEELIQGKVAGLQVTSNNGQPGAATTVKIRGNSSIRSGNNPLYVIDGVPLDGRSPRPSISLATLGQTPSVNPLIYINPNDIASISVLKGASATAIYGSRGANGVIIISTKKGQSGPVKVEANAAVGVSHIMRSIDILSPDEYRKALDTYNAPQSDSGSSVDAMDAILRNAIIQNYSLAFSGGNDKGKYRVSFLASDQEGIVKESSLEKYVANLGGGYNLFDEKLSLNFNLTAAQYTENIVPVTTNAGSTGNLIADALNWNPTMDLKSNGYYNLLGGGSYNPLALLAAYSDVNKVTTLLGYISAAYKILPSLQYKFLYGINHGTAVRKANIGGWYNEPLISGLGRAYLGNGTLNSQTFTHTLTLDNHLSDKLDLTALVGYEFWTTEYSGSSISAFGFPTNLTQQTIIPIPYTSILQAAPKENVDISSFADPTVDLQSYFARATFNYDNKYLLTGTFRADGSSKFGENNKYGYFPAIAFAWNISNEEFLKNNNTINLLKLRFGWGITGNQEFPAGASQEQWYLGSSNSVNQINVANPNLKWEESKSTDIGVDFALFNNRLTGTIDYFYKNTTNVLFQLTAIQPAPATQYFINLPGNIINKGLEVSLGGTLVNTQNVTWDLNVNASFLDNIFTNYEGPQILTGGIHGQGVSGTFSQVIANDQPVNVFYLKEFSGFDKDGLSLIAESPDYAGNPNPSTLLGISTSVNYKNFSLGINMHGAFGYLIYNNTATSVTNLGIITAGKNIGSFNLGTDQSVTDAVAASTRYLESGNFLKLGNATLSYDVGNIGSYIKDASVRLTGSNLFVITKFTGFDPEVNTDKSNNGVPSLSIEYVPYPTARTFTLGVNFSL